ncbi:unnamed protein product [Rotaria magnacalcarata]|uniref:MYND-type domain-containing protein n=1 Tax=Rotaria magnacalcarata TaxID=392030 RepID=A0A815F3H0_9BILA|nr:unnamed protein product [Rotaria magnacalcarata]CAF1347972.1 unnamed protein product [Rotaria magnacalcarata]CAF4011310.1 unnamed protein product [Rotaria magnacalcarata]CAF4047492.1 unnamed protein product [Rotaria magnacalcarata]
MVLRNIGVAEAENSLGIMYRDGAGVDVDRTKATQYFQQAAEHGSPEGQNNFGIALLYGLGIKKNETWARGWFKKAAECSIAEAESNYADLLTDGIGGPVDIVQALDFYHRAAKQGSPDALKKIQVLKSRTGSMTKPVVHDESVEENPSKLMLLASNYARGEGGVHKDLNRAEQYYRRVANGGHVEAEFALAELLLDHFKRHTDGFMYMKQAAEKNHVLAQWRLGKLLAFGNGCERNMDEARRWMKRAKRQGIKLCCGSGKDMIEKNIDVDQELKGAEAVCNFEQTHSDWSIEGMTIEERVLRYLNELLPSSVPPIPSVASLSMTPDETAISIPYEYSLTNEKVFIEVGRRANAGSITAQLYMTGCAIVLEASDKLKNSPVEGLSLVRAAYKLCERLPVSQEFLTAAQTRLEVNPNDADALHVVARAEHRSIKERIRILERCIEYHPLVADFHELLADMYMFAGEYNKAERACARALELEFNPGWLYTLASSMKYAHDSRHMNQMSTHRTKRGDEKKSLVANTDKIIATYNRFLELNPIDHKKVPKAHYFLVFMHMSRSEPQLARYHWLKTQETDDPSVRLPCHTPIGDDSALKKMFEIWIEKQGLPLSPPSPAELVKKQITICDQCGKPNPPKRCPCEKVNYCDAKCQRAHWSVHKKSDEHKK